ncbi:hypothetical protein M5K25_015643 [Dendrobium thyrsiflorum]|uniref:Uncharacterized protein n=1 Tax=Dendrobium thyrsiflorum TaxID=117978 RepID=A0ABD0URD1_DENTH
MFTSFNRAFSSLLQSEDPFKGLSLCVNFPVVVDARRRCLVRVRCHHGPVVFVPSPSTFEPALVVWCLSLLPVQEKET